MRYNGNLKLGQWINLFTRFKSSLIQSLNIFQTRKGIHFELQSLSYFLLLKKQQQLELGLAHNYSTDPFKPTMPAPSDRDHDRVTAHCFACHPMWVGTYPRVWSSWRRPVPFRILSHAALTPYSHLSSSLVPRHCSQ
jgi:hypothetical protein